MQQLLLRALVARFWEKPYRQKLVRWGTATARSLHAAAFRRAGFRRPARRNGRRPATRSTRPGSLRTSNSAFRCWAVSRIAACTLELRQAIEPWHVLGEEPGPGGTARYVDSSLERVQVKVQGLTDPRHVVTCNGLRVPLHPTGTNRRVRGRRALSGLAAAELPASDDRRPHAAGVRRLRHVDRAVDRRLQYHVAHPGGRSYETFPVNAAEAETRRQSRFFPFGHHPGSGMLRRLAVHPECPLTLDLRHVPVAVPSAPVVPVAETARQTMSSIVESPAILKVAVGDRHSLSSCDPRRGRVTTACTRLSEVPADRSEIDGAVNHD